MNELEKILKKGRGWILNYIINQKSINYLRGFEHGIKIGRNIDYKEREVYLFYIRNRIKDISIEALNRFNNDD